MAPKKQDNGSTKKRKRIPTSGSNAEASHESPSKAPKTLPLRNPSNPSKHANQMSFLKTRPRRLPLQEVAEARKKKRKRHFTIEQVLLWNFV
ncbi:hypothetical protein AHAS_Ahas03G0233600 [Arachis hypogaea]